jgi:hypothetical protein
MTPYLPPNYYPFSVPLIMEFTLSIHHSSDCGPPFSQFPLRRIQRLPLEDLNGIMNLMSSFRDANEFQDSDAGAVSVVNE